MRKILFLILGMMLFVSCSKSDRIDHQDKDYIYVWKYNKDDSVLVRYNQPRLVKLKVMGGRHKHHYIRVDFDNNGFYRRCKLPYDGSIDRCEIVRQARNAMTEGKPLIGVFREYFYPHHEYIFIKYEN